jgi:ubiquinone biosynthesis protein
MLAAHPAPVNGIALTLAVLITSIALVAGLAWASRRLLGLPVGTLRTLMAELVGFAVAEAFGRSLRAAQSGHLAAFFTVTLGMPLIAAMIFLVVAEALVPTGTGPRPAEVVRGVRRGCRARGGIRRSAGSRCGMGWARTRAVGGCGTRTRRAGGARGVAAACPGGGRGELHQAGSAAVHSP